jgi:hypothetical protein
MAALGGVLILRMQLFDAVIEIDAGDEFWQLVFAS